MSRLARPWLAPLVPLYRLGLSLRELRLARGWEPQWRLKRPVVSIGNLSAGGAGKTPLTIALARALARHGLAVNVLSRGYGRKSKAAVRVDPNGCAETFGDEPLLIARAACVPVYVAQKRFEAGQLAEAGKNKPQVHLLDDGFQHRQLAREVEIVLVSRADLEDTLLPAGNLREPLAALRRATIVAIPAEEPETGEAVRKLGFAGPLWRIWRQMEPPAIARPAVAFCGIARPKQFFSGLAETGIEVAARKAFADHHHYTEADLKALAELAKEKKAVLVTTEKDAARLGALAERLPEETPLTTARLTSKIEDEAAAVEWLLKKLNIERGR